MESRPWSLSKLNKLGVSLATGVPAPEDVPAYADVMRWYDSHTSAARKILSRQPWRSAIGEREFGLSSRTKTVDTLVEKLQRNDKMMLARVDDISGVRLEMDMTMREQDAVAEAIADEFNRVAEKPCKVKDLRAQDHQGYRAVHVIAYAGAPLEIQVRTTLQSEWANLYEEFADKFGRSVRYTDGKQHEVVEAVALLLRQMSTRFVATLETTALQLLDLQAPTAQARANVEQNRSAMSSREKRRFDREVESLEERRRELRDQHESATQLLRGNMSALRTGIQTGDFSALTDWKG
uniref:RelA/SpoT domain-containing protein n=1 Tax=Pseudoclavibacter sp. RFBI5 TaxID=2080578 RepID=UPI0015E3077F|nr:RelA/SpoT domain-containing protein [Pseudoclavibacter sp. RFBI5]